MNQYQKISRFIATLVTEDHVRQGEPIEFLIKTRGASRSSPEHIREFIYKIYKKAVELQYLEATLDSLDGDEKEANRKRQREIKVWLSDLLNCMDERLVEELKTKH